MGNWVSLSIGFEAFVIFLLIYGLILLFKVTRGLNDSLRKAFYLILASLSLQIVMGALILMLLISGADYNDFLWVMYPLFGLISAILLTIGSKKFLIVLGGRR